MFRSSGTHELYTKWPRGEAWRPRLRVRGGKVFVFELSRYARTAYSSMHSIVYSVQYQLATTLRGVKKGARPAYFCLKKNLNASRLCFLHIKKRSVICSVPSNIRTGPTDAKKGTYYEKSKRNKREKKKK